MDSTEQARRERIAEINADNLKARTEFEQKYGQVWDTQELGRDFRVLGFSAPYVVVERKSDGKKGTLEFKHSPRFYYSFNEA